MAHIKEFLEKNKDRIAHLRERAPSKASEAVEMTNKDYYNLCDTYSSECLGLVQEAKRIPNSELFVKEFSELATDYEEAGRKARESQSH